MRTDLHRIKIRTEVLAALALKLVELALVRTVECGRDFRFDLAARDETLQLRRSLGMIRNHLGGKALLCCIALIMRELVRFDFEQARNRDLFDEIVRGRTN